MRKGGESMIMVKALSYLDLDFCFVYFNMFSIHQQQLCDITVSTIDRGRTVMRVILPGA